MTDTHDNSPHSDFYQDGITQAEAVEVFFRLLGESDHPDNETAIQRLGSLIDLSEMLGRQDGIEAVLKRGDTLLSHDLSTGQRAVLHYFLSNAWEAKRKFANEGTSIYEWEQPELVKEIVHLRIAVQLGVEAKVEPIRLCQMHTNLGNLLSHCGRIVDAITSWDRALAIDPDFAMAVGNRGYGLMHYAKLVHDPGHQVFHFQEAYVGLTRALSSGNARMLFPEALAGFSGALDQLKSAIPIEVLTAPPHKHPFPANMPGEEHRYRTWCLNKRLFLNDLNDLGTNPIAAADVLTMPSILTTIKAPQPNAFGFFNQMKQEYVSGRYLYYEGVSVDQVHFSDHDVTLINTLDYPAYGLAVEKVKITFRIAYSLLDKVAYFLNDYLMLGIPEKRVSFRGLWYKGQDPKRGLREDVHRPSNAPLKGLFFLAKDLYENEQGFTDAMEPDAREVAAIRNHLEHKYFKLHTFSRPRPPLNGDCPIGFDALAYSMERGDFERRTLRLLRTAREALIYVSQVVHVEEYRRRTEAGEEKLTMPIHMSTWEDNWKS